MFLNVYSENRCLLWWLRGLPRMQGITPVPHSSADFGTTSTERMMMSAIPRHWCGTVTSAYCQEQTCGDVAWAGIGNRSDHGKPGSRPSALRIATVECVAESVRCLETVLLYAIH